MAQPIPTSVDEMTDILDLKEIIALGWLHVLKIIGLVLIWLVFLALVVWILYKLYKKYFQAKELSPDQRALRDLGELKKMKWIDQRNWRAFYFALDDIFRAYIQVQFGFEILDKTFEELYRNRDRFVSLFLTTEQTRLDPFLLRAQLAKFANGSATPDEALGDFEFVERFVQRTKIQPVGARHVSPRRMTGAVPN